MQMGVVEEVRLGLSEEALLVARGVEEQLRQEEVPKKVVEARAAIVVKVVWEHFCLLLARSGLLRLSSSLLN